MTNSPDGKIVTLNKEGEGASVVSISGKSRAEGQEGPMDLTHFLDMMQAKKKRALGASSPASGSRKAAAKQAPAAAATAVRKSPSKPKKSAARKPAKPAPSAKTEPVAAAAVAVAPAEAVAAHRRNPALRFLLLLFVLTAGLALFGAVLHLAERQARVVSEGEKAAEIPAAATPADAEKLLEILSKQ